MLLYKKIRYGFSMLKAEFSGKADYWHLREKAVKKEALSPGIYYLDMKGKGFYEGEIENGIPVFYLNGVHRTFFPITVLNYGLGLLNRLHDGEAVRSDLQKVLDFVLSRQDKDGAWRFDVPHGVAHEMAEGKVSGMTQGLAISFLVRCHRTGLLSEENCLKAIRSARNLMLSPCCTGNLIGEPFIEEFSVPGKSILNGSMFALLGLFDYEEFTGEHGEFSRFESALRNLLPRFNFGIWSYYDRYGSLCSRFYQQLHVDLMVVFYQLTGNPVYRKYEKRWQKGLKYAFFFVLLKAVQKLFQIRTWTMNADRKN
ncbi:MAG: D-glucuronyl C5-epimerase family protein [Bacteroidales bacterium]|nr:D-glucuronyl C5-epimerase family protein [Bacteroidales bacterium]